MTTTLAVGARRARTVGLAWLALSALAVAVFAPLRYLLHSVPDLAATGEEVATHYAGQPGWARTALVLHAGAGGLALLASPVQLSAPCGPARRACTGGSSVSRWSRSGWAGSPRWRCRR